MNAHWRVAGLTTRTITVSVTDSIVELATNIGQGLQRALGSDEPWTSVRAYLDAESRLDQIRRVELTLQSDLRHGRVLELGAGMGMFVTVARQLGIDIVGVEPGANSYHNLRNAIEKLLSANDLPSSTIICAPAENLPWPDGSFDHVVSFQVLEHVHDPPKVLSEAVRVLKPGGRLYFDMPNYLSFVEGHYGIAWLPALAFSKPIARAYVRLAGRNPDFIDELNFVTPGRLRRWTASLEAEFTLHHRPSEGRASPSTQDVGIAMKLPCLPVGRRFKGVAAFVRRLIFRRRVFQVLSRLGMADHIILTGIKR